MNPNRYENRSFLIPASYETHQNLGHASERI